MVQVAKHGDGSIETLALADHSGCQDSPFGCESSLQT
jgi:hypothetical protein